jgi:hypothetical protein
MSLHQFEATGGTDIKTGMVLALPANAVINLDVDIPVYIKLIDG